MKKHLEYKDEKSHKFWQIEDFNTSFNVTYGKVGSKGQSKTKEFATEDDMLNARAKLIDQKIKKGYKQKHELNGGHWTDELEHTAREMEKNGGDYDVIKQTLLDSISNNSEEETKTETKVTQEKGMNQESKDYAIQLIKEEVLFGFYTKEDMLQSIGDAFYGDDDYDEKWLKNEIKIRLKKHQEDSLTWKKPTDFDRLVKAFDQLSEQKIVALHRAGYTKQDAHDECMEVVDKLKKKGIQAKGYCYYHTQDLERAIGEEKTLFIGFESFITEDKLDLEIANKIVEILKQNGFEVKWNGKLETRIEIQNINWQKTIDNIDYGYKRIKKLMQDNVTEKSTENELDYFTELVKFDKQHEEQYSESFWIVDDEDDFFEDWLHDTSEEKIKEYSESVKVFASADGTGARYAFWFTEGNTDKNKAPIICYGSEGEISIVAENIKDLIKMLSFGCEGMDGAFYHGFDEEDYEDYNNFLEYFITYTPNFLIFRKWMKNTLGIKPVSIKSLKNNEEGDSKKIEKFQEKAQEKLGEKFDKWQYQFYPDPKEEDKRYYAKQLETYKKIKTDLLAKIEKNPTGDLYLELSNNEEILEDADFDQLETYLAKGLEVEPNHLEILKKYADETEYTNPKKSIELYTRLIEIHPKPEEFYSNIAFAYRKNKDKGNALEFYQKDIIANPNDNGTYSQDYIIDICKELKSKDNMAILLLEDALDEQVNVNTYKILYKLYLKKKKYKEATENALNYIKNSDDQAHNFVSVAEKFFKKDLYTEALILFNAIDIKDYFVNEMRVLNYIGLCLIRIEPIDIDNALEVFMEAHKLDNDEVAMHGNVYICATKYFENNEFEKAIKAFEFCIENDFTKYKSSSFSFIGTIHNKQGENKKALGYFEKALALDPKNDRILKNIQIVKNAISKNKDEIN